ncbi:hypothetical protein SERLA73DRAFT_73888 [Serpula lacrymans var. lacrymans S7.3]|uniref:Uncharacterized protein n=2 Tax=Serpula lacrymans var. lacrymans TaxID=341189 RepID=F8PX79_SERL3|nr:uncharacterized protein SERLADRAFT_438519 [Serpula lacrymans var. lacrymans S7.9]EGN99354.1 hypothetical protein SERLA73DRAFT_73888 [Serpula lacrymans var. lacrymans S7.3]EGO24916.1 hypothetical protein SERLADRAFT_438519 [Serpula lacrymans var. lacrymans S7.9]
MKQNDTENRLPNLRAIFAHKAFSARGDTVNWKESQKQLISQNSLPLKDALDELCSQATAHLSLTFDLPISAFADLGASTKYFYSSEGPHPDPTTIKVKDLPRHDQMFVLITPPDNREGKAFEDGLEITSLSKIYNMKAERNILTQENKELQKRVDEMAASKDKDSAQKSSLNKKGMTTVDNATDTTGTQAQPVDNHERLDLLMKKIESFQGRFEDVMERLDEETQERKVLDEMYQASEKKHRASEEKYRASEEKYRASEEKYRASEERHRVVYRASEEKHRASEERHRASEERHRVVKERLDQEIEERKAAEEKLDREIEEHKAAQENLEKVTDELKYSQKELREFVLHYTPVQLRVLVDFAREKIAELNHSKDWRTFRDDKNTAALRAEVAQVIRESSSSHSLSGESIEFLCITNALRFEGNKAAHNARSRDIYNAVSRQQLDSKDRRCLEEIYEFVFEHETSTSD